MIKDTIQYRAKRLKNDEFYTTELQVNNIFNLYLKNYDFEDKIIYCPCDSDKSEFVKYIKKHKDELKYKEFIYTWDDFNTHEDLFFKADIIITNPPFSKLVKEFIPILNRCKKDFFIFGAKITMSHYIEKNHDFRIILPLEKDSPLFNTPDPKVQKGVPIIFLTNIKSVPYFNKKLLIDKTNKLSEIIDNHTQIPVYDKLKHIAYNTKPFLAPSTILYEHNRYMFDILDPKTVNFVDQRIYGFSDGKYRYARTYVKFKDNLGDEIFA